MKEVLANSVVIVIPAWMMKWVAIPAMVLYIGATVCRLGLKVAKIMGFCGREDERWREG